jgi:hypothetical protein
MDEKRRGATATTEVKTDRQEQIACTIKAAVAQAVAKSEERELKELREASRKKPSISAFLLVVLLGFIASGIYCFFEMQAMSVPLDEEMGVEADAAGVHLYSIAVRLERFKQENGHYPASLDLMDLPPDEALQYSMISDGEYSIKYVSGHIVRTHYSTESASQLLRTGSGLEN